MSVTVLSPVAEVWGAVTSHATTRKRAPKPRSDLRIALLSNSKANVDHLFAGLTTVFEAEAVGTAALYDKGNAAVPAPPEMLEEISARSDLLITAMAD